MKLKEQWEILFHAEKKEEEKLIEEINKCNCLCFARLAAWARRGLWLKSHPGYHHRAAIMAMQKKGFKVEIWN